MKSRRSLLRKSQIYAILNRDKSGTSVLYKKAKALKACGAGMVQLRDKYSHPAEVLKTARALTKLFSNTRTLFIVNDQIDVARKAECDGVHLGQSDLSVKRAKEILGKDKIVGVSCHNLKQALSAQKQGADYIGLGPVFPTPLKPKSRLVPLAEVARIAECTNIPIFAIGGINKDNIAKLLAIKVKRFAFIRAVSQLKEIKSIIKHDYIRARKK